MSIYQIGFAYAASATAKHFGRARTGTWFTSCDDKPERAFDSPCEAFDYTEEKIAQGHERGRYCQSNGEHWPQLLADSRALAAEVERWRAKVEST